MSKSKLAIVEPKEVPLWRFRHPYGSIAVYCPANSPLTPERVLLLLEQAKHELLYKRPYI